MKLIHTNNDVEVEGILSHLWKPTSASHKGQNGKLLIIAGSDLFHAPLIWAAEIASRMVDMVHVSCPYTLNNQLMELRLKERFWSGIVVPWDHVHEYIEEDDVVLIGPGMTRTLETKTIVDSLLRAYPTKTWIVDGGALQEVEPQLLNQHMCITPHHKEWERLENRVYMGTVTLLKGESDLIMLGDLEVRVEGGNAGMTKGGTGDVLAGLVAALATKNDLFLAAQAGSVINKRAGDSLFKRVGTNFNASDLVAEIPHVMR